MNHYRPLLLILLMCGLFSANAQTLPDYLERQISRADSIKSERFLTATEGSIDPKEYTIGPGDKIFISISGIEEVQLNLIVNHEGVLYIPEVGGVDLNSLNLFQAKEKIRTEINKFYKNVDIFVSLADFRKIKVSLLGDVKIPGSYILDGAARLADLIKLSQGLTNTSNYRNILIKRKGIELRIDYLSFLRQGDLENNPYLKEGDRVIIDKVDKTVTISGEVKYPGIYEYLEGETVSELIKLAGGLTSSAYTDSIEIVSFTNSGKEQISSYYSLAQIDDTDIILKFKDHIMVRSIPEYYKERFIQINGFVHHPGYYKIIKDSTKLSDIITEAGGIKDDGSLSEARLIRNQGEENFDPEFERLKQIPRSEMTDEEYDYLKAKSRERKGNVVVDFEKLLIAKDEAEDVILKRGDKIFIPESKNFITLIGQINKPGNIIYQEGLSVEDYISLAGGFGWRAIEGDVRVIKAKTGEWIEEDDVEELEPGDTIWVPEDPPGPTFWTIFTTSLTILGQVAAVVAATIAVIVSTR